MTDASLDVAVTVLLPSCAYGVVRPLAADGGHLTGARTPGKESMSPDHLLSPHFDLRLFCSTFALVFVAEIPDKTALATLLLATNNRPFAVFVGVALAFVIQSCVAVLFGSVISLFPKEGVRIVAGALFLVFAVAMWLRAQPDPEKDGDATQQRSFVATIGLAFMVIFIAEWGDLTQLATAALAAKYPKPFTILSASILALWAVSAIAIVIGHHLKKHISAQLVQRVAAVAFVIIGILILCHIEL